MAVARDAAAHAGSLYRKAFALLRLPAQKIHTEAEHLRAVEEAGESGETPLIVFMGIILFLLPILVLMMGLAFAAYYLAR
jgi:hypothetical protein